MLFQFLNNYLLFFYCDIFLQIDCNNTIIPILLWADAYQNIPEPIDQMKGMTIALCGEVKKDMFKNEKKLYSTSRTKIYVLSAANKI